MTSMAPMGPADMPVAPSPSLDPATPQRPPGLLRLLALTLFLPVRAFRRMHLARRWSWLFPLALVVLASLAFNAAQQPYLIAAREAMLQAMGQSANSATAQSTAFSQHPLMLTATSVIGTLLGWVVRTATLLFISAALGGRASFGLLFQISAWCGLTEVVRLLAMIGVIYTTGQIVPLNGTMFMPRYTDLHPSQDLSGLVVANALLVVVDPFLLWALVLLGIGTGIVAHLSPRKTVILTVMYAVLAGLAVVGPTLALVMMSISTGMMG